jgi:hypothetical protein
MFESPFGVGAQAGRAVGRIGTIETTGRIG